MAGAWSQCKILSWRLYLLAGRGLMWFTKGDADGAVGSFEVRNRAGWPTSGVAF